MHIEDTTTVAIAQHAGNEPRRPENGESETRPTPPPASSVEPPVFRTWHPDTCDERRLRRRAR